MATQCWMAGRIEAAVRYSDEASKFFTVAAAWCLSASRACSALRTRCIGQPERWVEWCRTQLARGRDTHNLTRAALVAALMLAGCPDEAMAATTGLIDAAEATRNHYAFSAALLAYGFAFRDADPDCALMRFAVAWRSPKTAATTPTRPTWLPSCAESKPSTAIRSSPSTTSLWPSATTSTQATPPLSVARWLSSPPFSIASDATSQRPPSPDTPFSPMSAAWSPEVATAIAHLREVLGDRTYESLARKGETMTTAALVTYAYDQIDQARADLNEVSK